MSGTQSAPRSSSRIGSVDAGLTAASLDRAMSTRVADERVGGIADQMKEKVSDVGHEALERGREVAQEVKDSAVETVRERGGEEAKELGDKLAGRLIGTERRFTLTGTARDTGLEPGWLRPQARRAGRTHGRPSAQLDA